MWGLILTEPFHPSCGLWGQEAHIQGGVLSKGTEYHWGDRVHSIYYLLAGISRVDNGGGSIH